MKNSDGKETKIVIDSQGRPARFLNEDGSEVRIAWLSDTVIEVTILIPGEQTSPPIVVDLQNPTDNLSAENKNALGGTQVIEPSELPFEVAQSSTIPSSYPVDTVVTQCGTPRKDAYVEILVKHGDNIETYPSSCIDEEKGTYRVSIPTFQTGIGATVEEICSNTETAVGFTCEFSEQLAVSAPSWCLASSVLYLKCVGISESVIAAHAFYCNTLGFSHGHGGESLAGQFCTEGGIDEFVERAIDNFKTIYLSYVVTVDGDQLTGSYQESSGLGPYPSFEENFEREYIISTEISPTSGTAPLTVQLSASRSIAWPNTEFTYTWESSDGQSVKGQEASIQFTQPGEYGIRMTFVDEYGCTGLSDPASIVVEGDEISTCASGNQTVFYKDREWQRCDDGNIYSWEQANAFCNTLVLGGYSDWRLPDKNELKSLVYCSNGHHTPLIDWDQSKIYEQNLIDATCCSNPPDCNTYEIPSISSVFEVNASIYNSLYWTSETYGTSAAWWVTFGGLMADGGTTHIYYQTNGGYARCVR